jgi:hypothetical protein
MDLEENFDERHEFFFLDLVLETENENYNVSIQEKYHPLHAPLEENFDLSCVQFESNNHDENVATNSQMAEPVYIKPQEQCLHWMNINYDESHHFTSNFYDIDCSSEAEFNEEDIFQASKEGNLQQEDPWVICFISEDNEVVDEQQKTTLQFPTNVQQQFIFATSPWKHSHCIEEECFQDIVDESRILDVVR